LVHVVDSKEVQTSKQGTSSYCIWSSSYRSITNL